jgi:hypothetical protein
MIVMMNVFGISAANIAHKKSFKGYFCFLKNYPDPEIDLFEMVTCTRYKSSYNDIIISVSQKIIYAQNLNSDNY